MTSSRALRSVVTSSKWRTLAVCCLALIGLLLSNIAMAPLAEAAAPISGKQAPGFYRFYLGKFEITVLSDGTHVFPVHKVLTKALTATSDPIPLDQASPGEADALLADSNLTVPVQGSINAFLINTGSKLILIDSGAGTLYGACCGQLLDNLQRSGYRADQIDEVYLTHLHADHVGGIAPAGKIAFPNAVIRVSQADADYWLSEANEKKAPKLLDAMFEGDRASLTPYIKKGMFKPFAYGDELSPGITPIATPGHTPGHTSYRVISGDAKMLVWGDVVHVSQVQFPDPSVTVAYDNDAHSATAERQMIFAEASQRGYLIGAAHISFPGLGHVRTRDGHFYWVPANYDANPTKP